jgi:hypothetical protein
MRYLLIIPIFLLTLSVQAQKGKGEGTVQDEEINVSKDIKPVLPQASRLFEKIPIVQETNQSKPRYEFVERKLPVATPQFSPTVVVAGDEGGPKTDPNEAKFSNVIRGGVGNFGHTFLEGHGGFQTSQDNFHGIYFKHDANRLGPVGADNSARSQNLIKLHSKSYTELFKLSANIGWERRVFHYYGFVPTPYNVVKDSIRNSWNKFHFNGSFSNPNKEAKIDYVAQSGISYLFTSLKARELEWNSKLNFTFPITDNLVALLDASMNVTQYTDVIDNNRSLYKVKPSFQYKSDFFSASVGLNVANDKDKLLNLNSTQAFPIVNVDVQPLENIHIFGGFEGDIYMNTFGNMLLENQWINSKSQLKNTKKSADFYVGTKGVLTNGINFDAKLSFAQYKNFYVFKNAISDTTKFDIFYSNDTTKVRVVNFTGQLGYQFEDKFRSLLKIEYNNFAGLGNLKEAWHRPAFTTTFSNTFTVKSKLFVSADMFLISGIKGGNPYFDRTINLPTIFDANVKVDYLFFENFSLFVSANNILNKNYQRFTYYPQQGINFLVGLSYSF